MPPLATGSTAPPPPGQVAGQVAAPAAQAPVSLVPKLHPNGDPAAAENPVGAKNTDSCLPLHGPGLVLHDYASNGAAPGDIALRWMHGSVVAATNTDPRIQVIAYNEDTYILRENPCVHWEAPFTYLLFGNERALLINTGATPEAEFYPLRATVDKVIARWCSMRRRPSVPLTVVFTSGEDVAQNQGRRQFVGRPGTTLVPLEFAAAKNFYGLATGTGRIDLGQRLIEVVPTPGTHRDGVTFYDNYTGFLYTGDLLYPGRIQIANDRDYVASLTLLKQWSENHPVKWVMGGHVEMMFVPGRAYPRFANYRPFEHLLQLETPVIQEALTHATAIVGQEKVVFRVDFILLNRVGPDEQVYRTSNDMPDIPVPFWLP